MFGLSFWEIGVILAIALIVLGPSKLPELARGLGKGLREFRRATEDFKSSVTEEMYKPEEPRPALRPPERPAQATDALAAPAEERSSTRGDRPTPVVAAPLDSVPVSPARAEPPPAANGPSEGNDPHRA